MSTDAFTYVVADDYGTQTGTVTVTVSGGAFVSASDDTKSTLKGTTVTISPLGNDTFSTGLGPLRIKPGSLSTPSPSGTATIAANGRDVEFSPASGYEGDVTFNYTAQSTVDSTKEDTAQVRVTVSADTSSEEYPAASSEIQITSASEFTSKYYNGSVPNGTHFVVADNVILPGGDLTKGGSAGAPVVIRAKNNQKVKWSGSVGMKTSHLQLWGFDFGTRRLTIGNSYSQVGLRVRRCAWSGVTGTQGVEKGNITVGVTSGGYKVEYCQMTGFQWSRGFWCNVSRNGEFRYCLFKDWTGTDPAGVQVREPLVVGEGENTHLTNTNTLIEWCYFENINQNNAENEAISNKSSNNTIRYCRFVKATNPNQRFGNNNRFYALRVEDGNIEVKGRYNTFNSVYVSGGRFQMGAGNWDSANSGLPSNPGSGSTFPNAVECKLIGCRGNITVGAGYNATSRNKRASGLKFEGHISGTITNEQGGSEAWTTSSSTSEAVVVPPTLLASQTGVYAGL